MDYADWFYCLDADCLEHKNYCEDCKYWNRQEGYNLEQFLAGEVHLVVEESGYRIFVHSDRIIKYVRVACEKTENLLFNLDYTEEEKEISVKVADEIWTYQNDVCHFGNDFRMLPDEELEFVKNLIRKHRDLIEEKFLRIS